MAQESILFPNDPPQDGDQFTIGNTTYAWDPTPGIWRAFTTATSSSSGGGVSGALEARKWFMSFTGGTLDPWTNSFTIPADGDYFVFGIGNGGAAGGYYNSAGATSGIALPQPSAGQGGIAYGTYSLTAGDTIDVVSPGPAQFDPGNPSDLFFDGVAGGDITVTVGSQATFTLGGGGGSEHNGNVAGGGVAGVGGVATGGQVNVTGRPGDLSMNGAASAWTEGVYSYLVSGATNHNSNSFPAEAGSGGNGFAGNARPSTGQNGAVIIMHLISTGSGAGGGSTTVNIGGAGGQVYFGNTPTAEPAESMGSLFYRYDTTDPANDTNTTIYNQFYINVGNNTWRRFATASPSNELRFAPSGLDAIVEPNWASPTEQITTTGTWTVPTTLTDTQWVFFYLIGGGGGTATSDGGHATGGGAGAALFAVPAVSLTEASYNVTIGAGGPGRERGSGLATATAGGTTILDFDASSLYGSGLTVLAAAGGGGANANGSVRNGGIGGLGGFRWYDGDHALTTVGADGQGLTRVANDYATGIGLRGGTGGAVTGSGSPVFAGAANGVATVFAGTFGRGGLAANNSPGIAGVFRVYY